MVGGSVWHIGKPDAYNTHIIYCFAPHPPPKKSPLSSTPNPRHNFLQFCNLGPEDKYGNGTKDVPAVMGTLIKSFALVLDSFVDSLVREAETLDFKTEIEQDIELELTALEMAQIDVSI